MVITGGMGRPGDSLLEMNGIKAITGVTGEIKDVVDAYLADSGGTGGVRNIMGTMTVSTTTENMIVSNSQQAGNGK